MDLSVLEHQEHATSTAGSTSKIDVTATRPSHTPLSPQTCPTCGTSPGGNGGGATTPSWIYALGNIEARFPNISVEKEFFQCTGREKASGPDRAAFHAILSKSEYRYLVRQLCFVMTVAGLETYLLQPRDPGDCALLVEAIRPNPSPLDLDAVIGIKGPIAPQELCNGLMIPIVFFDQIYSFDREKLIKAIPKPTKGGKDRDFELSAEELFDRIKQLTDNAGATDEHRALNYLAVRYDAVYAKAAEQFGSGASLTAVDVQGSLLSSTRKILDVIFSYTQRSTDVVEKFFVRVDVTDEFPFLVTKLSPYYNR
jgi:hypothetical protein